MAATAGVLWCPVVSAVNRAFSMYRTAGLSGVLAAVGRRLRRPFATGLDVILAVLSSELFRRETGRLHGVGFFEKCGILRRFVGNARRIRGGSHWTEHLLIAAEILAVPPEVEGDVCECGSFQGLSAANLSLVCRLAGRRLVICDSFEGLPEPKEGEGLAILPHRSQHYDFQKGQYRGTLETVRANITRYGAIEVCDFVEGYFEATLPGLDRKLVVVFEDADLPSSVQTCLEHLWGKLADGGVFFCHEPWSQPIVGLFYDRAFWRERFESDPAGFYGSGIGMPLGIYRGSGIGFARKTDVERYLERSEQRPGMW